MAKIGTAHVEIKPVLNQEALDLIVGRIQEAIVIAAADLPFPCRHCGSLDHTAASGHPSIEAPPSPSMGRDHDRMILEGADDLDTVVVVRCPHTIGLCYLTDHGGDVGEMLGNLPCPCNDRSEIVAKVVKIAHPPLSIPPTPILPLKDQA